MANIALYRQIIAAIDTAILNGVSCPGRLRAGDREIEYRDLEQLTKIRGQYAAYIVQAQTGGGIRTTRFRSGGSR